MSNIRLYDPKTRIYLAHKSLFADFENPTKEELNSNPTNSPNGLIWNLTCAVDRANSTFDLGSADVDDSLSFCQSAGDSSPTTANPEIVLSVFRSDTPWIVSDSATFNTANLAFSLLSHRGVDYVAIMSLGEDADADFSTGDRVKMATVGTTDATDNIGTGESVTLVNNLRALGDVAWNVKVV